MILIIINFGTIIFSIDLHSFRDLIHYWRLALGLINLICLILIYKNKLNIF